MKANILVRNHKKELSNCDWAWLTAIQILFQNGITFTTTQSNAESAVLLHTVRNFTQWSNVFMEYKI